VAENTPVRAGSLVRPSASGGPGRGDPDANRQYLLGGISVLVYEVFRFGAGVVIYAALALGRVPAMVASSSILDDSGE
jgi:hypothetical protein